MRTFAIVLHLCYKMLSHFRLWTGWEWQQTLPGEGTWYFKKVKKVLAEVENTTPYSKLLNLEITLKG